MHLSSASYQDRIHKAIIDELRKERAEMQLALNACIEAFRNMTLQELGYIHNGNNDPHVPSK
jgi:hypothetical protein